jgi:hypothetical protein
VTVKAWSWSCCCVMSSAPVRPEPMRYNSGAIKVAMQWLEQMLSGKHVTYISHLGDPISVRDQRLMRDDTTLSHRHPLLHAARDALHRTVRASGCRVYADAVPHGERRDVGYHLASTDETTRRFRVGSCFPYPESSGHRLCRCESTSTTVTPRRAAWFA